MSKIAEQKALKAYPIAYYRNGGGIDDANASDRAVYEEGYDQAMQDFLEKAEEFFNSELYVSVSDQICSHKNFTSMSNFIELFKNYIQNEM